MKLNKWTVGLAAVGVISLSSVVQAEETEMNVVNAMTSGTTISGYVSTSFAYNFNTAVEGVDSADSLGTHKANGFNLDVVNLTVEKPLDESEWAAGYKAEMLFGPDATGYNPSYLADDDSDFAVDHCARSSLLDETIHRRLGRYLEPGPLVCGIRAPRRLRRAR